mmetsp:Transcript_22079/g.33364  ORF Transcript_22079/g.33364 Transcript_22079/m.33364 type:complete len:138 (+) Transcript_22079:166-579(+)
MGFRPSIRRHMLQQACLEDDDSMNHEDEYAPEKTLWKTVLQPMGWTKFATGSSPLQRGFIPASLSNYSPDIVKKYGVKGTHYAVGYDGLAIMMRRYGVEHSPQQNRAMKKARRSENGEVVKEISFPYSLSCCRMTFC